MTEGSGVVVVDRRIGLEGAEDGYISPSEPAVNVLRPDPDLAQAATL